SACDRCIHILDMSRCLCFDAAPKHRLSIFEELLSPGKSDGPNTELVRSTFWEQYTWQIVFGDNKGLPQCRQGILKQQHRSFLIVLTSLLQHQLHEGIDHCASSTLATNTASEAAI